MSLARPRFWIALAVALALLASHAFAGGMPNKHHGGTPPKNEPPRTTVNVTQDTRLNSNANAASESNNTNTNVAHGGAGGSASVEVGDTIAASGDSSATGGNVSITSTVPKNTPDVIAPSNYPTVPCFRPASGGAAVAGFGISGGGGAIDKDCTNRENDRNKRDTAQAFASIGESDLAHAILCTTSDARAVFGDHCPVRVPPPPLPAAALQPTKDAATPEQLAQLKADIDKRFDSIDEKVKRAFKSSVSK